MCKFQQRAKIVLRAALSFVGAAFTGWHVDMFWIRLRVDETLNEMVITTDLQGIKVFTVSHV